MQHRENFHKFRFGHDLAWKQVSNNCWPPPVVIQGRTLEQAHVNSICSKCIRNFQQKIGPCLVTWPSHNFVFSSRAEYENTKKAETTPAGYKWMPWCAGDLAYVPVWTAVLEGQCLPQSHPGMQVEMQLVTMGVVSFSLKPFLLLLVWKHRVQHLMGQVLMRLWKMGQMFSCFFLVFAQSPSLYQPEDYSIWN